MYEVPLRRIPFPFGGERESLRSTAVVSIGTVIRDLSGRIQAADFA